jgi:TolB-like protein
VSLTDVFLSYNREDQATARRFAEAFEREGFSVWWDQTLRSGEAYDEVTEGALRGAKAVVVLWSKKSVVSRWVRAEATLADRNRTLVPAMIEACERPIMFELTQTADLSNWGGEANDRTWLAFLTDVRRLVGAGGSAGALASIPEANPSTNSARLSDDRPSLAILPFTNRSGERADDVFADGMVEDLISALSLNDGLKVIAQSATIGYRKNVSDLRTIGRELNVRYLLEGNVRRVGTLMRVTAQLVEAGTSAILWSQKFERPLAELAELQELLVSEVAGNLGVQVERIEIEKALKKPGELTAWEAVMRSHAAANSYTGPGAGAQAIAEARKAVAISPDYALGHATLAAALAHNYMAMGGRDPAMAREGLQHADRALALAPSDPGVLAASSIALCYFGRWRDGLQHARRSVALNPNLAMNRSALAMLSIRANLPEEATANLDVIENLAPRGSSAFLTVGMRGLAHFLAGRYEPAIEAADRSILLNPGFIFAMRDRAVYCEKLGRHEEARETVRRLRVTAPQLSMDEMEAATGAGFMPPEATAEMSSIFRKVWADTPVEA